MSHSHHATRVVLVDVPRPLAEALQSALARIAAEVVASLSGPDAVQRAARADPGLLVVGPVDGQDAQRARCTALRAQITAPLVVLVVDGLHDGLAFTDDPAVDATLVTAVGIEAMVGQLPVVLDRWRAWRTPRVAGPLRVDRAEPAIELFGMAVKVPRAAAMALASYADRRRAERRSGPLPRVSRITGSLPRLGRRATGPLPSVPAEPDSEPSSAAHHPLALAPSADRWCVPAGLVFEH